MRKVLAVLFVVSGACGDWDELTCEVTVNGVDVCLDANASRSYCEKEWGGTAANAELEPGGPFAYCADVGYPVACAGTLVEEGDNFTANHAFQAATEDDCVAAAGGAIGG